MSSDQRPFTDATVHLASNTTLHGPSHIVARKSLMGKLLWLAVLMGAFGLLIWQFITMVEKYYTYPVTTSTSLENQPYLNFPAITFCNVNPVRLSQMNQLSDGMKAVMKKTHQRPGSMKGANMAEPKASMQTMNEFYQLYALMKPEERGTVGHQLDNMLVDCMWNGKQCMADNFTRFINWKYGNCYTFNQGADAPTEISRDSGPLYGLHLTLYIQEDEYVKEMTQSYGVKVVVHNQTDMPFPEDSGFFVAPGEVTAVGLRLMSLSREDPPHGKCYNVSNEFLQANNAFLNIAKNLEHTHKTCEQTCLQRYIIEKCNCTTYKFPNGGPAFDTLKSSGYSLATCNDTGKDYSVTCMGTAKKTGTKGCQAFKSCPVQCLENLYSTTISSMQWPSDDNIMKHLDDLLGMAKEINDTVMITNVKSYKVPTIGKDKQMDFLQRNMIVLNIYYENFYVQSFITAASYGVWDLLSDLGGTCGLWMGLSIITIIEFIEFFIDLFTLLATAGAMRNRTSHLPAKVEGANNTDDPKHDIELTKGNYITPVSGH